MPDSRASRFAFEVLFLVALAVAVVLADLRPLPIAGVMLAGWVIVALLEWAAWRDEPHYASGLPPRYYVPQVSLPPRQPLEQVARYPSSEQRDEAPTWIASAALRAEVLGGAWPVAAPPSGEDTQAEEPPAPVLEPVPDQPAEPELEREPEPEVEAPAEPEEPEPVVAAALAEEGVVDDEARAPADLAVVDPLPPAEEEAPAEPEEPEPVVAAVLAEEGVKDVDELASADVAVVDRAETEEAVAAAADDQTEEPDEAPVEAVRRRGFWHRRRERAPEPDAEAAATPAPADVAVVEPPAEPEEAVAPVAD